MKMYVNIRVLLSLLFAINAFLYTSNAYSSSAVDKAWDFIENNRSYYEKSKEESNAYDEYRERATESGEFFKRADEIIHEQGRLTGIYADICWKMMRAHVTAGLISTEDLDGDGRVTYADCKLFKITPPGSRPLKNIFDAVKLNKVDAIRKFIMSGVSVNAKNKSGSALIHIAVSQSKASTLELLLDLGADVSARDRNGNTALHLAAKRGESNMVTTLMESGAQIDAKNKNNQTPLNIAALYGRSNIQKLLKSKYLRKETDYESIQRGRNN